MTGLEITLSFIIYIALGLWICFKRDWYDEQCDGDGEKGIMCVLAVVLMPVNLLIVFFREFVLRKWNW